MPETEDEIDVEKEDEGEDSYVSYDIATYPSDYNLQTLYEQWRNKDIEIPSFQRSYVWSIKQASLLIESFLLGLPVPNLFFYVGEDNKSLVVDGQQRLTSICYFLEGYFGEESAKGKRTTFRLNGLSKESPYYRKTFEELSDKDKRKFLSSPLRVLNIRQLSPDDGNGSIFHIFERLNTGGTSLRSQEIRNCVYRGDFVKQLQELNLDPNWRKILGQRTPNKHQSDVELILRVFAFHAAADTYSKPMKEFLNNVMKNHRTGNSSAAVSFYNTFPKLTSIVVDNLGEKPFHIRRPLNRAAMDVVMAQMLENIDQLPQDLGDRFHQLRRNEKFLHLTHVSTSDETTVKDRLQLVRNILFD